MTDDVIFQIPKKNMSGTQRLLYLDFLKFFAIFCVCYGHCIQHFLSGIPWENTLYRIIYSFHMPLFMVMVGYFSYGSTDSDVIKVITKKFRQLLLPGISFSILLSLMRGFPNGFQIDSIFNSFWFLQCAFICCAIYSITCYVTPKKFINYGLIISLIIAFCIIYKNVFRLYPAFLTGVLVSKYQKTFEKNYNPICVCSFVAFIIMLIFLSADFFGPQNFSSFKKLIITGFHLIYRIAIGSIASVFFFTLAYKYRFVFCQNKIFNFISILGKYTLIIYILQTYILEMYLGSLLHLDTLNPVLFYLIFAPLISVVVIAISIMTAKLIGKSRIASFFLLGKKLQYNQ